MSTEEGPAAMNEACIVDIRGGVYGPFPSRSVASDWASALAGEIAGPSAALAVARCHEEGVGA
jgi:hypothetical protein